MALPEQVVNQLGRESNETQGWALGFIFFSGGILFLVVIIYLGLVYGYQPYLEKQIANTQTQITTLNNSISPTDQANLINFYSQISNLKTLLQHHTLSSQFFAWLEKNTQANVAYQTLTVAPGYKITATGYAISESDVNQQISIFENSPEVKAISISGVESSPTGPGWTFNLTLTMDPSLFAPSTP